MSKRRLSFLEISNMSFGFLGIQFGWGLQLANMSAIYTKLGANPDDIPFLWLAGPVTGLVVQPIIGAMSDRTWNRLGRRRPYFLVGAVLASVALVLMPDSRLVATAAGLLWCLDASINVSMEPFRAFVADKLDASQRTAGFVMQSFFIGVGASLANALPYIFRWLGVEGATPSGVPLTVKYSFQLGGLVFLLAVLWTVLTTSEDPPDDLEAFRARKQEGGVLGFFADIAHGIRNMPATMRQLALVQFVTWLGLFCMWMFFGLATARHVFGATDEHTREFDEGIEWGGVCFAVYSIVCFAVAFLLPALAKATSRKTVHAASLACGGVGLLAVATIRDPYTLLLTMVGVGIAWASILSMPYAILASSVPPDRMGLYMGVFNFFIVLPEIVASLTFKPLVKYVFDNNPLYVVMLGGVCLLVAAACVADVRDDRG
jgi:maltose/moltooligosaccharide transporter